MDNSSDDKQHAQQRGLTRRGFLTSVGTGAVVAATAGRVSAQRPAEEIVKPEEMCKLTLFVKGRKQKLLIEPWWSLLFVLREKLGLTGTKVGCARGECGACTVLVHGVPHYACMMLALEAEGRSITTGEGLMNGEELGLSSRRFQSMTAFSTDIVPRARCWLSKTCCGRNQNRRTKTFVTP